MNPLQLLLIKRFNLDLRGGPKPITIGCKIFRIGASAGNYGGDTGYLFGTGKIELKKYSEPSHLIRKPPARLYMLALILPRMLRIGFKTMMF